MQPIILIALLSRLAVAAIYPRGTACHTNIECNTKCANSEWTITAQDNEYGFACTQDATNPTLYYQGRCWRSLGLFTVLDTSAITKVCKTLDGFSCDLACITSGTSAVEEETRKAWQNGCTLAGAKSGDIVVFDREDEAKERMGCHF